MRFLKLLIHFILLGWLFSWLRSLLARLPFFHYLQRCWQYCWVSRTPFVKNLVIGSLFALLFVGLYDSQWIADIEDLHVDWMISLYRGQPPLKASPHFVLLDIDNKTYREWKEPALTPRDKLLKLLDFAVTAQPKLIIVDIMLASEQQTDKGRLEDAALLAYLANYETQHCQTACPHILLARGLRLPSNVMPYDPNVAPYYLEQAPSFLEATVAKSPHIHWAAVLFDREKDRILRRWQLWTPTCTEGKPAVVPSMSLLSTTLLAESTQGAARLQKALDQFKPHCSDDSEKERLPSDIQTHLFKLNNISFDLQPSRLSRRILYTIPWQMLPGDKPQKTISGSLLLKRFPAFMPLQVGTNNTPLHDSITLIGGSFLAGRDWHSTPLGWMPGMYVLANSIHSLQQYGVLEAPPAWQIFLFAIVLIVLTSWLLTRLHSFWAMLISVAVFIIILIPISFYLFRYGVWLSFAIPLAAIQLRQLAESFKEPVVCQDFFLKKE